MKASYLGLLAAAMLASSPNLYADDIATGRGTVNRVNAASVNISHEAIPALKWPAMTMDLKVTDRKVLAGVKPGQTVTFGLTKDPQVGYVISHMEAAK